MPSVINARDSLAKGSRRYGDLRNHVRADQRATVEGPSLEPASCCFARSSIDGCDRSDDSRASLSRGQLRNLGSITGDDVNLGVPLSGPFFFEWAADVLLNF